MSSGGLVSALTGLKQEFVWIGWPGIDVPEEQRPEVTRALCDLNCFPVYLSAQNADMYYSGFSNSILWPLFHYHPGEINFSESYWLAYIEANQAFATAICPLLSEGDLVWIHDYHLMLYIQLIQVTKNASISNRITSNQHQHWILLAHSIPEFRNLSNITSSEANPLWRSS